jgi:hypothetical protein
MLAATACQWTAALQDPAIFELERAAVRFRNCHREIQVDEMAVVAAAALEAELGRA